MKGCSVWNNPFDLRYIDLLGNIRLLRYVFPGFSPLPDTFSQQIFDLAVDRAKIVLRPGGNGIIELGREAERDLLLLVVAHINTGFPS